MSNRCSCHAGTDRRTFLADCGMGFTGLVLGSMLGRQGIARAAASEPWAPPDGRPHFAPKAKSVIWLFMLGGVSHVETWDPKPALSKYAGKEIGETPFKNALAQARKNVREFVPGTHGVKTKLYPLQSTFRRCGHSGVEISEWLPHLGGCVDDIALIRSVWTTDNDHTSQLQFNTGRHVFESLQPSLGSWIHYGLGALNDELPQFVVLGAGPNSICGGDKSHGPSYLGPLHAGVPISTDPGNPLPFAAPGPEVFHEEQAKEFDLLRRLNKRAEVEYPSDPVLRARIKSYELAFRMQVAVPEVLRFKEESEATRKLYGLDLDTTRPFGEACLTARRLVERGVRFVQIYHGGSGSAWDAHQNLQKSHQRLCEQTDQPIAALLKDLKQRGLLAETIVVWGSEFGRSPGAEGADGRDHHPFAFSIWMAGGGIKAGVVHGATDDLGFHPVENPHYVTDIHATVLHQLGLDPHKLEIPGQKRLEIDYGSPIKEII